MAKDKKPTVVDVTTEFREGAGVITTLLTAGLVEPHDHYVTTVTLSDGTVKTGEGSTKEKSIKNANS